MRGWVQRPVSRPSVSPHARQGLSVADWGRSPVCHTGWLAPPASGLSRLPSPLLLWYPVDIIGDHELVQLGPTVPLPDRQGMHSGVEEEDRHGIAGSLIPSP